MNRGFWLVALLLFLRHGLMALINRGALPRAAHFAPMEDQERGLYYAYQAANVLIPLILCFLPIRVAGAAGNTGLVLVIVGALLCARSVIDFALARDGQFASVGVYRFSRNPMYLSYNLYYLGCALLASSWMLLALVAIFVLSAHFIILAEERWCLNTFGQPYHEYMQRTGRYLGLRRQAG